MIKLEFYYIEWRRIKLEKNLHQIEIDTLKNIGEIISNKEFSNKDKLELIESTCRIMHAYVEWIGSELNGRVLQ